MLSSVLLTPVTPWLRGTIVNHGYLHHSYKTRLIFHRPAAQFLFMAGPSTPAICPHHNLMLHYRYKNPPFMEEILNIFICAGMLTFAVCNFV